VCCPDIERLESEVQRTQRAADDTRNEASRSMDRVVQERNRIAEQEAALRATVESLQSELRASNKRVRDLQGEIEELSESERTSV